MDSPYFTTGVDPLHGRRPHPSPGRRRFLAGVAAASAAVLLPAHVAAYDQDDQIWMELANGGRVRMDALDIAEQGIKPALTALEAQLTVLGLFNFVDAEGRWEHGRIRDFLSRMGIGAVVAQAITKAALQNPNRNGTTSAKAIGIATVVQIFLQIAVAYIQTTAEYCMYRALKKIDLPYVPYTWEDEVRRYLSSALGWAAAQSINGFVTPYAVAELTRWVTNTGNVTEAEKARCDNILVLIPPLANSGGFGRCEMVCDTPVNQWNHTINSIEPSQEFMRRYRGSFDTDKLIGLIQNNPGANFYFTTTWDTVDHDGEADNCYSSHSFSVCESFDDDRGTRQCVARVRPPYKFV